MWRVVLWIVVASALVMTVDRLWLDRRLASQLPIQSWLDGCTQAIERFGQSLVHG